MPYQLDKNRIKIISYLGGKCIKCGFTDIRALQLDHIHGHGNIITKHGANSGAIYHYYLSHPEQMEELTTMYQVLCSNCNWIKRYENNESNSLAYRMKPFLGFKKEIIEVAKPIIRKELIKQLDSRPIEV